MAVIRRDGVNRLLRRGFVGADLGVNAAEVLAYSLGFDVILNTNRRIRAVVSS
jgi:hypothetical protein